MKILVDFTCERCGNTNEYFIDSLSMPDKCSDCAYKILNKLPSAPGMVKSNFHDGVKFKSRK